VPLTIEYTDWENYLRNDGVSGTIDWTSAATLKGMLRCHVFDALRQAFVERLEVIGLQFDVDYPPDVTWGYLPVGYGAIDRVHHIGPTAPLEWWFAPSQAYSYQNSWMGVFDSWLERIIGTEGGLDQGYVWVPSGVSYHGCSTYTSLPCYLTLQDVLDDLGEEQITPSLPLASWAAQRYRILNKLVWTVPVYHCVVGESATFTRHLRSGTGVNWAARVADFEANSWSTSPITWPGHWASKDYIRRGKLEITLDATPSDRNIEAYLRPGRYLSTAYVNPDYPTATQGVLNLIGTEVAHPADTPYSVGVGAFDTVTLSAIRTGWVDYYGGGWCWCQTLGRLLSKYDIPTGFKFQ